MADISDVEFSKGYCQVTSPSIVIGAETARMAIDLGELDDLIEKAINALEMTGNSIVFIQADIA